MKATLYDLITSKKFLAALSAIVVYAGGRFGLHIDLDTLDRIFAALLVYVGAQGLADNGKSAAKIAAASGSSKIIVTSMLFTIFLSTVATPACTTVSNVAHAIVDCTKLNVDKIESLTLQLTEKVTDYLIADQPIDWSVLVAKAESAGVDIGACALGPVVNSFLAPAPGRSAPSPEQGQLAHAAFERVRADAGGGAVKTLHAGTL